MRPLSPVPALRIKVATRRCQISPQPLTLAPDELAPHHYCPCCHPPFSSSWPHMPPPLACHPLAAQPLYTAPPTPQGRGQGLVPCASINTSIASRTIQALASSRHLRLHAQRHHVSSVSPPPRVRRLHVHMPAVALQSLTAPLVNCATCISSPRLPHLQRP